MWRRIKLETRHLRLAQPSGFEIILMQFEESIEIMKKSSAFEVLSDHEKASSHASEITVGTAQEPRVFMPSMRNTSNRVSTRAGVRRQDACAAQLTSQQ